jgi:hypothetical protein
MSLYDPSAALYVGARVELSFKLGVKPRVSGRLPVFPDGTPCHALDGIETWYCIIPDGRQDKILMPAIVAQRVLVAETQRCLDAPSLSPASLESCNDRFNKMAKSRKLTVPKSQVRLYPALYAPLQSSPQAL